MNLRKLVMHEVIKAYKANRITKGQLYRARRIRFPTAKINILGTSTKVQKNLKRGFLTSIVYLAPSSESITYGGRNICPFASLGCSLACLGIKSYRLRVTTGRNSKAWKTLLFVYRRDLFKKMLMDELYKFRTRAKSLGLKGSVRLNGTSDILYEEIMPELFTEFPDIAFYDYTKIESRLYKVLPTNYHLTFSRSEDNEETCKRILNAGKNVAMVFKDHESAIKNGYLGYEVVNGDLIDFRPLDKKGIIIGLSVKGHAKDSTGFII